jgi:hypothetical protein
MALISVNPQFYKPNYQPVGGSSFLELKYDPSNGNTILEVYNVTAGIRGPSNEVYKNGVWNVLSGGVNTAGEKEKVHSMVKDAIKNAAPQSKGVVPSFVLNNEPSKDFQGQGNAPIPSQSTGGILGGVANALFGPLEFNVPFTSENEKDLFGDKAKSLLRYPDDILENNQDTFVISQYNYQAPGGDVFTKPDKYKELFTNTGLQRNSALKDWIGTTILPMPNKVVDQNGVNWGSGDSINSISMAMGGYGYQNTAQMALGQGTLSLGEIATNVYLKSETAGLGGLPDEFGKNLKNMLTGLAAGGAGLADRGDFKAMLTSLLLKNAGYDIPPETILSRGFGVVPNSNLELLFNGPALRGFTFGYRMTPRSQKEAANVRRIIRFFKQGMAARKMTGQAGQGSAFLKTPNVFKLRYQSAGKPIPGVNKFKICALTQFAVDYTPESQWTAYEDPDSPGQPVSVVMNLRFNEIEPVYESDYQENNIFGTTKKDLETVTDKDVGY